MRTRSRFALCGLLALALVGLTGGRGEAFYFPRAGVIAPSQAYYNYYAPTLQFNPYYAPTLQHNPYYTPALQYNPYYTPALQYNPYYTTNFFSLRSAVVSPYFGQSLPLSQPYNYSYAVPPVVTYAPPITFVPGGSSFNYSTGATVKEPIINLYNQAAPYVLPMQYRIY